MRAITIPFSAIGTDDATKILELIERAYAHDEWGWILEEAPRDGRVLVTIGADSLTVHYRL